MRTAAFRVPETTREVRATALVLAAAAWLPAVGLAMHPATASDAWQLLVRVETHVRAFVAIPLLLVAERRVDAVVRECDRRLQLLAGAPVSEERLDLSVSRALIVGLVALLLAMEGLVAGWHPAAPAWWAHVVATTIVRALVLRTLASWSLWGLDLWRASRRELQLVATHPDRAGGLGFLVVPSQLFGLVVAAVSILIAAAGASRILIDGARLLDLAGPVASLAVVSVLTVIAPLLPFTAKLADLRVRSFLEHGELARRYSLSFEKKWGPEPGDERLLGSPDIQSLADLSVVHEVVAGIGPFVFTPRLVTRSVLVVLVPMLPLVLTEVPLTSVLVALLRLV